MEKDYHCGGKCSLTGVIMSEYVSTEECKAHTGELLIAIRRLEQRLYQDNGTPSIQTKLDRNTRAIQSMQRLVWLAVGAFISSGAMVIAAMFVTR